MSLAWIIPLAIVAIAASNTMDEIRFHWSRAFGYWFNNYKLEQWFNPSHSWENKYWSENKYIQWIFMSPLVFITDFWHFLKFLMLNCIYGIIVLLVHELGVEMHWIWLMIGMNIGWGFFYEFVYGIYGLLGDKWRIK
jgi:hypothetical protein